MSYEKLNNTEKQAPLLKVCEKVPVPRKYYLLRFFHGFKVPLRVV